MKQKIKKYRLSSNIHFNVKKRWYESLWAKIVAVLGAASLAIGMIIQSPAVKDVFLTDREKYIKATFLHGKLRMPMLIPDTLKTDPELSTSNSLAGPVIRGIEVTGLSKMHQLSIIAGTFISTIDVKKLYNKGGISLDSALYFEEYITTDYHYPFRLYAIGDRLFFDAKFVQLNDECIGWIEANHWYLYKSKSIFYRDNDENLEVSDQDHQIMFSANYDSHYKYLNIAGYFNDIEKVYVLSNDVQCNTPWLSYRKNEPGWLKKARRKIGSIKPTF